MAQISSLPSLILLLLSISGAAANSFIRASCSRATYPTICVSSLSLYAATIKTSPSQLVRSALAVSLDNAKATKLHVQKLGKFRGLRSREYAALRDCLEEMEDSVDQLSKSINELNLVARSRGANRIWHMSNLQTWLSSAMTDQSTCMDGFAGRLMDGSVKISVRAWMTNLAKVTSNSLALCHQFAGRY